MIFCDTEKIMSLLARLWILTSMWCSVTTVKMREGDAPTCGEEKSDCFNMTMLLLTMYSTFSRFWSRTIWLSLPHLPHLSELSPTTFFLCLKLKLKLKVCCFDTTEEPRWNCKCCWTTLSKRTFREHSSNGGSTRTCVHGNYLKADRGQQELWWIFNLTILENFSPHPVHLAASYANTYSVIKYTALSQTAFHCSDAVLHEIQAGIITDHSSSLCAIPQV